MAMAHHTSLYPLLLLIQLPLPIILHFHPLFNFFLPVWIWANPLRMICFESGLPSVLDKIDMGACGWFKKLVGKKKKKENRPKKLEIHQDPKIANGSKSRDSSFRAAGSRRVIGRSTGTKEFAATRIQTAYRAYRARKALRCLKGASRFHTLIETDALMKQASSALDKIHFWSKVQAEIRTRRHWMVTEGRINQKKLENQVKTESKLHELEVEWCGGPETMEEIVSRIQHREEATNKRVRAMAYAFYHQWRANSNRYFGQTYYDISKESWGWSWMDRWIAVCPWEARVVARPVGSGPTRARQQNKPGTINAKHVAPKMVVAVKGTTKATYGTY